MIVSKLGVDGLGGNCYSLGLMKNNERHYSIELHATDIRQGKAHAVFNSARAFFSTDERPATKPFVEVMMKAIKKIGGQQVAHGWVDYAIGELLVQDGFRKTDAASPELDYHKGSSHVIWKTLDQAKEDWQHGEVKTQVEIEINSIDTKAIVDGEELEIEDIYEFDCEGHEATRLELEDGREFINHDDHRSDTWEPCE